KVTLVRSCRVSQVCIVPISVVCRPPEAAKVTISVCQSIPGALLFGSAADRRKSRDSTSGRSDNCLRSIRTKVVCSSTSASSPVETLSVKLVRSAGMSPSIREKGTRRRGCTPETGLESIGNGSRCRNSGPFFFGFPHKRKPRWPAGVSFGSSGYRRRVRPFVDVYPCRRILFGASLRHSRSRSGLSYALPFTPRFYFPRDFDQILAKHGLGIERSSTTSILG